MMDEVRLAALAYLAEHQVMTLATVGKNGVWAAAVFYSNDGFDLFFLSAGHTRHAQNLITNPRTAVTIQEDYKDWPQIKGIQVEGVVTQVRGAAVVRVIALYQKKYPFLTQASAPIRSALAGVNWYQLRPNRFYFIDNSKGLGHRDEIKM